MSKNKSRRRNRPGSRPLPSRRRSYIVGRPTRVNDRRDIFMTARQRPAGVGAGVTPKVAAEAIVVLAAFLC
jgi:hypothetical protein